MFERMEAAEQVYKGVTPSKIPTREEANCDVHVRKQKGGESALPTNTKKGRAGKHKTKNAGHTSDAPTEAKKKYLLHVPKNSHEECKLVKTTLKSNPRSGPINLQNTAPAAIPSVAKPSSSTTTLRK